jgi:hypothetical protein
VADGRPGDLHRLPMPPRPARLNYTSRFSHKLKQPAAAGCLGSA